MASLRPTVPPNEIETLEVHLAVALADPAIPLAKRDELAQRFAALKAKLTTADDPYDAGVGVPSRRIVARATGGTASAMGISPDPKIRR